LEKADDAHRDQREFKPFSGAHSRDGPHCAEKHPCIDDIVDHEQVFGRFYGFATHDKNTDHIRNYQKKRSHDVAHIKVPVSCA
jgi:hypothetical protein